MPVVPGKALVGSWRVVILAAGWLPAFSLRISLEYAAGLPVEELTLVWILKSNFFICRISSFFCREAAIFGADLRSLETG